MAGKGNKSQVEAGKESSKGKKDDASKQYLEEKGFSEDIGARALIRDTVNGYVFWSIFQALAPMIWFYPLNELEISGYEAFAVVWLIPIVCEFSGLLQILRNRWAMGLLRLASVASLASFQAPSTLSRLIILAAGAGTSSLVLAATLFSPCKRIRCQTYWSLSLGLFAFITSRIWFVSFVPTWWNDQTNSVIIALGFIAALDQIVSGMDKVEKKVQVMVSSDQPAWFAAALGFGSLLFLTHWCFGEVSLITRWVVKGYPDPGPQPGIWGYPWSFVGAAAFFALYYLPTWQGYIGGLVLGVYTASIWPAMVNQVSACAPGRTLALANLVYIVEVLFLVWTVAFNFVPGGEYTREHSDWLIGAVMLFIVLGLRSGGRTGSDYTAFARIKTIRLPTGLHRAMILLIVVIGLLGFGHRQDPHRHELPKKANPRDFTAAIWTYHFGYDNKGWPSLERSAELLNNTGADVITLLESDASKPFLGNNDLGMWLGERLGMYVDFGPSTKDHTWGNLLLSKYPIVKSTHHLLPSPHGELAPAITATINIAGQHVDFVVTHMGNDRDVLDRKLQASFLADELRNCKNPAVFLGYVTSQPGSRDYKELISRGGVKDIDETDKGRWCEYIMYKGLIRLGYARVTHGGLSDTEVQIGRFRIPEDPKNFVDNRRLTKDPARVDKDLLFNSVFGTYHDGHGYFSDHRFHMSTPKYFLP
ncbi:hypothetical protein BaRGS_00010109 [Batillaria attramentaria]|uniref:PGAP2-interacting protein n=1 Tax=Batillaria attramentaria TaxID=370345 RepID=A0ABD0LI63_9CAEN